MKLVPETKEQREARELAGGAEPDNSVQDGERPPITLFSSDECRVIRLYSGRLPEIVDAVEEALASFDDGVYVGAAGLVRIYPAQQALPNGIRRAKGSLTLHPVDATHLSELAGRVARFEKYDGRAKDWVACDCPRRVAETVLARGKWPKLPDLAGFIQAPSITPDNRIMGPGYDADTGLFGAFGEIDGYTEPPDNPTRADAIEAADYLAGLFRSFPLLADEDRTGAIAGILTVLVRRLLPAAPMIAITAPTPGTGKTMLGDTYSVVGSNMRSSVMSLGHDESETEKRLGGVLLAGDLNVMLDNIERPLGGDLLCQVLTQPSIRMRPLGVSTMVSVPTHSMLVATGNNLAIVGDLKRRVMLIRLDAKVERPELRQFEKNHLDWVGCKRGEIITAGLTIIKAYLTARAPSVEGLAPFGSFEEWDLMVRRPLCWLGLADPLGASEGLRTQDPDIEAMRLLFTAWGDVFNNQPKTVADVVKAGMSLGSGFANEHDFPELYDALQLVCAEKVNSRRAGYWLRSHRDRIVDGMRLEQVDIDRKGIARWRVRRVVA